MRIIAGKYKGYRIDVSRDIPNTLRPTSDFAREAIFNILMHRHFDDGGHPVIGKPVVDVFCGTGAFGLEALSRGASHVTFIDQSREALANARYNVEKIKETAAADYLHGDATKLPTARRIYSLVFLDPPYFGKMLAPALASLQKGGWISHESLIVIEHDNKEQIDIPSTFQMIDERRYGRASIRLLKLATSN